MNLLKLLGLFVYIGLANGYNFYMVLCPDTIRPGMEFVVQFNKLARFPKLTLYTQVLSDNGAVMSDVTEVLPNVNSAKIVLNIPRDLPSSSYTLEVSAKDASKKVVFTNSTSLMYMEKGMSIYIQTDKAIYKPGHKVQFRAFGSNPDLSVVISSMDISIYDPNNNKIAQWLDVQDASGVYQGDLQLSDQPPLGDWRIEVLMAGQSNSMSFTVAEYVLPHFEVIVTAPSFGVVSDKYLSGKVEAKYTYGKGVEGNGTLTIKQQWSETAFTLSFKINGIYNFDIAKTTLEKTFGSINYAQFELLAVVEEGLTGNTREGTAEITYYETREKLVFMDGADNFKPGLKYTAYLYLSDQDDKPLSGTGSKVNLTVTMYYGGSEDTTQPYPFPVLMEAAPVLNMEDALIDPIGDPIVKRSILYPPPTPAPEKIHVIGPKTVTVPPNGIVPFTFSIPIEIKRITISAQFKTLENSKYLQRFRSTSNTYIQVSVATRNPKTGKVCAFKIQSTIGRIQVNYLIISKGLIVKNGAISLRQKSKTLRITMTSDMAPSARCVVYWVREDAEIIADSVQFNVEGIFENQVSIDYLKPNGRVTTQEEPGKPVVIRIKADPESHCSVLTVDKSVLLLKSGNDITPEKVENELESYDSQAPPPCDFFPCWRSFFPVPVGGTDVTAIFQNSGLQVLTDAFLYQYQQPYYYRGGFMPMPMMAMAMFDNAAPAPEMAGAGPRVRSFFPETWVYSSAQANINGTAIIETTIPDTITSWVASAFAVNKKTGLGVALNTANLEVFLKFFIRLDLPYSVIRGEQVILQANIFNYYDTTLEVKVVLKKSSAFQNIIVQRNARGNVELVMQNIEITQTVKVPAKGAVTVNLPIVAVELGNIDVEVSAVSSVAGDAVRKQLLVEPEGIAGGYNIPVLIDLQNRKSFTAVKEISVPNGVVKGSTRIRISAIGDLMGPSISGLADLLSMPYGCGEQNLITFVPDIFIIKYLDAINNLKPSDENKAKGFMLVGYQRELTYQHYDGSFSAFGNSDPSGSTWLTAFVVKSFSQAVPYIYIDPTIMQRSIDWLLGQYLTQSGLFSEPGHVIHTEMQGGSASGERNLASYTLVALLEAKNAGFSGSDAPALQNTISGATAALESEVSGMEDIFQLAVASYTLALTGSNKLNTVLSKLDNKATKTGGMKFWVVEEEPETNNLRWMPPYHQARSRNIETTAYVLLSYAVKGDIVNGLQVIKWLVNQRNANGGFGSTQDTVIALQALAEFGALIYSDSFNMNIGITGATVAFSHTFSIVQQNALVLQSVDAPAATTSVSINATGSGMGLVEIAVSYNVMEDYVQPLFSLTLSYQDETMQGFKLNVCFRWLGDGVSGMAVLEIGLLSGFGAEKFSISNLGIMKRVEDGDKSLIIYLEEIPSDRNSCLDVRMQREGLVAGSQPAVVKLYDYYQPENHAFGLYQPTLLKESSVCNIAGEELGC